MHFLKNFLNAFCVVLSPVFLVYLILYQMTAKDHDKMINETKKHFIVYSVYYYKTSKLYDSNSMILLMNAHKDIIPEEIDLRCFSENRTLSKTSRAKIKLASYPGPNCLWEFFIVSCSTVSDPDYFGLTSSEADIFVELNFDIPVRQEYPVVMCYPPMVYESRWQQIIFAIEIYRYYGTDMQIQYINSAMEEIVEMLEIYEKKGFIKIEKFAFVDFDAATVSKIGTNPMLELNSRNQPLALTDCLMKYREAAEFIIVADVDDVLFPRQKPFYKEFSFWNKLYSNSSAFMYFRSYAKIEVAETFDKFSLETTIKTLRKVDRLDFGKTVYKTKNAEASWIHWPGLKNATTATVPPNKGRMLHVQVAESKLYMTNLHKMKPFYPIPDDDIQELSSNFMSSFKNFPSFKANQIYAESIFKCYQGSVDWNFTHPNEKAPCVNPLQCEKPKFVKNYKCKVARRDFFETSLSKDIVLHIPNSDYYWWTSNNGCKIFLN